MPGYVIHLAVAEEYLKKHNKKQESYKEFINGIIAPDNVKDKSLTHYGKESSKSNLVDFLEDREISSSYNRGYFLHLFTDYMFYNKYIDTISKDIYNDYDLLNRMLINRYEVKLPEEVVDKVFFVKNMKLKILSQEVVIKFIDEVSEFDIDELKVNILNNKEEWTKFRELIRV